MESDTDNQNPDALAEWILQLGEALAQTPGTFDALLSRLEQGRSHLLVELASAIQPRFNAYIKTLPQDTYEEKCRVVAWLNHVMRSLDLAIRSPKTGEPSILLAEDGYNGHPKPRFRFQGKGPIGRLHKSNPCYTLPDLELMPAPPRREGMARWSEREDTYKGPRERRER